MLTLLRSRRSSSAGRGLLQHLPQVVQRGIDRSWKPHLLIERPELLQPMAGYQAHDGLLRGKLRLPFPMSQRRDADGPRGLAEDPLLASQCPCGIDDFLVRARESTTAGLPHHAQRVGSVLFVAPQWVGDAAGNRKSCTFPGADFRVPFGEGPGDRGARLRLGGDHAGKAVDEPAASELLEALIGSDEEGSDADRYYDDIGRPTELAEQLIGHGLITLGGVWGEERRC